MTGIWQRVGWGAGVLVAMLASAALPAAAAERWYTYEESRLLENPANDGDSFHVQTRSDHKLFRLYFVDCPEKDLQIPERVDEQAAHFGITRDRVLALGTEAAAFARDWLAGGMTVWSRREDARGNSSMERFYALVQAKGEYLDEALVSRGLARAYGRYTDMPDGSSGRSHLARLRSLEKDAQRREVGGWAKLPPGKDGAIVPVAERDVKVSHAVAVFSPEEPSRLLAFLKEGSTLRVLKAETALMVRVRYKDLRGTAREGLCRRGDLNL